MSLKIRDTMDKLKDVVYVFRHGANNSIALRYSLRSLVNVPDKDKVIIVGDKPDWLNTTNAVHIPCKDISTSPYRNSWHKVLTACQYKYISRLFYLFNDDFFILKPMPSDFLYYHKGKIVPVATKHSYRKVVYNTCNFIRQIMPDKINVYHYGVHFPFIYNKTKFIDMHRDLKLKDNVSMLSHRILYGNYYDVCPKKLVRDSKVYNVRGFSRINVDMEFISTCAKIENSPKFEKEMSKIFPNKSIYEL